MVEPEYKNQVFQVNVLLLCYPDVHNISRVSRDRYSQNSIILTRQKILLKMMAAEERKYIIVKFSCKRG